jgi:hypothetical protein
MTRLLFTTPLCALGTVHAFAQSEVSQRLLELYEDERNAAFTLMLRGSNRKCDQVTRTLFNGTVLGVWTSGRRSVETGIRTRLVSLRSRTRPSSLR